MKVLGLVLLLSSSAVAQGAGNLTVEIDGFQNEAGQALIAVHADKSTFLKRKEPFRRAISKIENRAASVTFENLPYGPYSVSVFHDENANMDLDAHLGLIPKEDYGFSNNVWKKYGPPKFKDTLFRFQEPSQLIKIRLVSALKKGAKLPDTSELKLLAPPNLDE